MIFAATAQAAPKPPAPQAAGGHSITIGWNAYTQGTDIAVGFNVYRSTTTGGPYAKITLSELPITALSFADTVGTGGVKYYYVVTAVDAAAIESAYSNEVNATFIASSPNVVTGVTAKAN